jgi:hypothetical protein
MNAASGSRVSITVDGASSGSLREVLLEEREAIHDEREQLVGLDLLEDFWGDRPAVRMDVRLEAIAMGLLDGLMGQREDLFDDLGLHACCSPNCPRRRAPATYQTA